MPLSIWSERFIRFGEGAPTSLRYIWFMTEAITERAFEDPSKGLAQGRKNRKRVKTPPKQGGGARTILVSYAPPWRCWLGELPLLIFLGRSHDSLFGFYLYECRERLSTFFPSIQPFLILDSQNFLSWKNLLFRLFYVLSVLVRCPRGHLPHLSLEFCVHSFELDGHLSSPNPW